MFIVATISINSYSADKIEEIIRAGATVLRYNFAHGSPQEMIERISVARNVIEKLGKKGEVVIMADLPGAKIRLGNFEPGKFVVKTGQEITFLSESYSSNPSQYVPVNYPKIASYVEVGQEMSTGDGELGFVVTKIISKESFKAEALNDYHVPALKALNVGLNVGSILDEVDHLNEKTITHIKNLSAIKPELVAFSFVNSIDYLLEAKKLLKKYNPDLKCNIVSKVETEKGVKNIKDIAKESDYVIVARGDLGLTVDLVKLGLYQKKITKEAKSAGKKVIVSTQILESILNNYVPSRAEILDLTNIVLDGADGIMLAKETGVSLTPGRSVATAKKVIEYVEKNKNIINE